MIWEVIRTSDSQSHLTFIEFTRLEGEGPHSIRSGISDIMHTIQLPDADDSIGNRFTSGTHIDVETGRSLNERIQMVGFKLNRSSGEDVHRGIAEQHVNAENFTKLLNPEIVIILQITSRLI